MAGEELLDKYREKLKETINPGGLDWEDIGFDEPLEGCATVEDWLFRNGELDETAQAQIQLLHDIVEDLEELAGVNA